ncbi:hypothetical protein [Azospirillum argentinense]
MGVDDRRLLFGLILPLAEPVARCPRLLCELAKRGVEILRFAEAVPGMVVTAIVGVIAAVLISPSAWIAIERRSQYLKFRVK